MGIIHIPFHKEFTTKQIAVIETLGQLERGQS